MAGPSEYQVALIIIVGTIAMLMLSGTIVLFMIVYQKRMIQEQLKRQQLELGYQQKLMEAALESQENERRRLAGDLHDSIGGMLSTIRVGLTSIGRQIDHPEIINHPKQMLDDTITSVRRISLDLMPPTLERFGLTFAIKELCERLQLAANVPVVFHDGGQTQNLSQSSQLMIFRVAQELINNAVKHSNASAIHVTMAGTDRFRLIVEDNGMGFDVESVRQHSDHRTGLGLFNIENRARVLNATLEIEASKKKGSKITMTMPI